MKSNLSVAKVASPRIRNVVARQRLFYLLDSCREYPVTWLSAPAGSGKTTLVASYLAEKKLRSLWYQVDEGDGDVATFFYYMGLAAAKVAPRKKASLPLLTPEYLFGIPTFTLRYFEDLYRRLNPPFFIVFDNYQLVADDSAFHDRICQGIEIIPEGINVVILSRLDPPAQFTRLRANEQIHVVEPGTIGFTGDESKAFVSQRFPGRPFEGLSVRLHEKTQGWAAGLVLLTERMRTEDIEFKDLSLPPSDQVFNYFAREIFEKTDRETQEVLLATAFLPAMTASMAEDLTGTPRSREILSRLSRDHFFTQRDNQPDPHYQYHPLFRDFLLSEAGARMPEERHRHLRMAAAKVLEEAGQIEDAAGLLLSVCDAEEMSRFFLAHAPRLVSQGRNKVVDEWLGQFPRETIDSSPWLLYHKGMNALVQHPEESEGLLEKAFTLFTARHDALGQIIACSGAMKSIYIRQDNLSSLDRWVEELDVLMKEKPSFLPPKIEAEIACDMALSLYFRLPYRADMEEWLERALTLTRQTGDVTLQLAALNCAAFYFFRMSDSENMAVVSKRGKELFMSSTLAPLSRIGWKMGEACEAFLKFITKEGHGRVLEIVSEGLGMARESGVHMYDRIFLYMGIAASLLAGELTRAAELLRRLEGAATTGPGMVMTIYQCYSALYYRLKGDTARSMSIVRHMSERHDESQFWIQVEAATIQAGILHQCGARDEALQRLAIVKGLVGKFQKPIYAGYLCALDEAWFLLDGGQEEKGLAALALAMAMGRERGYGSMRARQPSALARLCAHALEHRIEVDYVRNLIRTHALFPDSSPLDIELWPWAIEIHTLGRFELRRDGKPVEFSGRVQRKPLDLLKALLALGGKDAREEAITDMVWPDASGDAAHHSFEVTLQRLRALLGYPEALQLRDGCLTLNARRCWVDLWAFDHLLREVKNEKMTERSIHAAQAAMAMYRGHFLAGENDEPWMLPLRERLRSKFLGNVKWLGERYEQSGRWQEALESYQKGLEVDDLLEELYRRLMTCHHRLGQKGEALSAYYRCKKTLSLVFGVSPSSETERLYRAIKESA